MSSETLYQRRVNREKMARREAEKILEQKSMELYQANKQLKVLNESLERLVGERTQELQKSELRLSTVISNLDSGILLEDEHRNIVVTNQTFCDFFKIPAPPAALIGMNCTESAEQSKHLFKHPDEFVKRIDELLEVKEICVDEELTMKDGRVLERGYIPIFAEGKYLGHLWQYRDVTLRKIEISEIAQAKQVAEEAQNAEKEFLASMSHEIRTPLNAVIGMANLLYDTRPTEEQIEYLDIIQTSSNILQSLISDILDLTKIEAGKIEYNEKPLDLVGLVRALQKTFQIKMSDKSIEVEAFVDAAIENYILSDHMLINQILLNLLGNAEKFTKEGHIGIQIKLIEKKGMDMLLRCKVYDTGIGIEESRLGAIFEKFKQANSEVKVTYGGTGLGLPITKKLIEFLGGQISVASEVDRGTTFTFTLPVKDAGFKDEEPKKPQKLEKNMELDKLHILVVEDNEMNRRYLSGLFKRWNIQYRMAVNGQDALDLIDERQFDLILMDIQMPVMNGYETTIAIRNSHNLNTHTPIIALTASALRNQRDKAFSLGMNGHITKPFTPNQLMKGIKTFARGMYSNSSEEEIGSMRLSAKKVKPANSEMKTSGDSEVFVFSAELDQESLFEFFEGDMDYAKDMFESFFLSAVPEIPRIMLYADTQNWVALRKLAHKIAPTFSIVGLTEIEVLLRRVEELVVNQSIGEELFALLKELEACLPEKVDLIQSELNRMNEYHS